MRVPMVRREQKVVQPLSKDDLCRLRLTNPDRPAPFGKAKHPPESPAGFCQNSGLSRHGGKLTQKLGAG